MATKIYLEGAFVLIEINTQKTRIPKSSFVFNFVGETDTVRFRSVEASFQPISEIWTDVQDQSGASAGATKEAVETYLSELPSSGGGTGGGDVTVVGDNVTQAKENHLVTSGTGSGGGTIPGGFHEVTVKRLSGNVVLNGNFTLNNAFRAYTFEAQNTRQTNAGTPPIIITGNGSYEWIALDNKN